MGLFRNANRGGKVSNPAKPPPPSERRSKQYVPSAKIEYGKHPLFRRYRSDLPGRGGWFNRPGGQLVNISERHVVCPECGYRAQGDDDFHHHYVEEHGT